MNKIEVNGLILYYSIEFDCSEYDEWEWTEFFLKTTKKTYKKYWLFGPLKEKIIGNPESHMFNINFSIKDKRFTKVEVRNAIEHAIEIWQRPDELKRGEII